MKKVIRNINKELSLPIHLVSDTTNVGLYTPTDGGIGHIDTVCNFTMAPNGLVLTIKDGMDLENNRFVRGLTYVVQWGDGNSDEYDINNEPNTHTYQTNGEYIVTITITTPWGRHINSKTLILPQVTSDTLNVSYALPNGDVIDSDLIQYTNTSGVITMFTTNSRLSELKRYGNSQLTATITDTEGMSGVNGISQVAGNVYTYYIDRLKYMDDTETGITTVSIYPNSFTSGDVFDGIEYINEMLEVDERPVVHQEVFHGITGNIDIQSDIFIDRGKHAPFEFFYKLGEVSNMKELENNGNKFFVVNNINEFKL